MRIVTRKALTNYAASYKGVDKASLEEALKAWFREIKQANWNNANDIKAKYRSASILKKGRVVFNICGNKFRIIVWVNYSLKIAYIKWVGTHTEYDKIDAAEV
jgi:mRNA interferase HigB